MRGIHKLCLRALSAFLIIALALVPLSVVAVQPSSVWIDIYQTDSDGITVLYGSFEITEGNGWYLAIPDLPKYDAAGELYTYTVVEQPVDGYDAYYYVLSDPNSSDDYFCYVVNQETPTFTVTILGSYAGAGNTGAGEYAAGAAVTIRAGSRPGYTFAGWTVNAGGVSLANNATASFFMPANDVIVTANWQPEITRPTVVPTTPVTSTTITVPPVVTTTTTAPPMVSTITTKPCCTTTPSVTVTEPPVPTSSTVKTQTPTTTTTMTGTTATTPLPPTDDTDETWALLNLIFCVLGALLAVVGIVWAIIRRKEDMKIDPLWLFITVITGVAGVVVFLLTEDMSLRMAWVDAWTIVNAIILVLGAISFMLAFKRDDDKHREAGSPVIEGQTNLQAGN
ncbi:MAG: Cna B-type domain-containing protein [Dehalococcoidia bacterium]|nr:Cna B-type domain-containing protein [Dehalococcoidia bacterium]